MSQPAGRSAVLTIARDLGYSAQLMKVVYDAVVKKYGPAMAVDKLDLQIPAGEFVVLLGPSGCGKTTTLRMLAGLETVTSGEVDIGEQCVNDVSPRDRDVAMVFQSYALCPHMTVADNIAYPATRAARSARQDLRPRSESRGAFGNWRALETKT
jgi:ABC-type sugar transport system ATPase subunit